MVLTCLGVATSCKQSDSKLRAVNTSTTQDCGGASGIWTQKAFEAAETVIKFLEENANRPECAGLLATKPEIEKVRELTRGDKDINYRMGRFMTLPREVSDLVTFMKKSPWLGDEARRLTIARSLEYQSTGADLMATSKAVSDLTFGAGEKLEVTRNMSAMPVRLTTMARVGAASLDKWFASLQANSSCLSSMGASTGQFLQTGAQLIGAFASADTGSAALLGDVVRKFVKLIESREMGRYLRALEKNKIRKTLTCLISTITSSYCSADDSLALLETGIELSNQTKISPISSPTHGYEVIFFHVPAFTDWLQSITNPGSVRVRKLSESYRAIMSIPVDIESYRKILDQQILAGQNTMLTAKDRTQLVAAMAATLKTVASTLEKARFPRNSRGMMGGNGGGEIPNFLDSQKKYKKIPFLLAGIREEDIPNICIPGSAELQGRKANDFKWYIANLLEKDSSKLPESFESIEAFRKNLRDKLDVWLDQSENYAMEYFWNNMPFDFEFVGSKAAIGNRTTPIKSMIAIQQYLLEFIEVAQNSKSRFMAAYVPNVIDTVKRLEEVLKAVDAYNANNPDSAKNLVATAYKQFQMVFHAENLVPSRLNKAVEAHINAIMMGEVPGKEELERSALLIAERGAVSDLFARSGASASNLQAIKQDISAAKVLSLQSLEALEAVVGDFILDDLRELRARSKGSWDAAAVREDSYIRSVNDARKALPFGLGQAEDRFSRTFVDWFLLSRPRAKLNRALHRDIYPMPADGAFVTFQEVEGRPFSELWSNLCAQTLSLPGRKRYQTMCTGSTYGIETTKETPVPMEGKLMLSYDTWWSSQVIKKPNQAGWTGGDPVCTLYEYQRRWRIYTMVADQYLPQVE
jgi:hypothetical protein